MRRFAQVGLAAALSLAAWGAIAGSSSDSAYKCPLDTQTCLNQMTAELKGRGWVGIEIDMDEKTGLNTIHRVVPGSPAEAAGFKAGDVLVAVNGISLRRESDSAKEKARIEKVEQNRQGMTPGKVFEYGVLRGGKEIKVKVTLAALPSDVMAQMIGMHMMEHAQPPDAAAKK
jgi:C-terminal processing protease CtpA/Prc